jgi:flagellar protein FliO/FliZ
MLDYILRLLVLIPLVGGLAWGSLWLWRRAQAGGGMLARGVRAVQLVDTLPLSTQSKLAVVDFEGQRLLIAISRNEVRLLAERAK